MTVLPIKKGLEIMNTLKAVSAVENLVNETLENEKKETATITAQIRQEAATIKEANATMVNAVGTGDTKAYQKAKADCKAASDAKELLEKHLAARKGKPLIAMQDYEKAVSAVFTEIAALDDQTKRRLAELSEQMESEAEALAKAICKADEVLHRLQHDVYRDADRTRNKKTGEVLNIFSEEKKIKNWDTVTWGRESVLQGQYVAYTGKKPQPFNLWIKG